MLSLGAPGEVRAEGGVPIELVHEERLGAFFKLEELSYQLNGAPFVAQRGTADGGAVVRMVGELPPGLHALEVTLVYRGDSAVFSYVNDYRFTVSSRLVVKATAGQPLKIHTAAITKDPLTTEWKDRPAVSLVVDPPEAVQDEEVLLAQADSVLAEAKAEEERAAAAAAATAPPPVAEEPGPVVATANPPAPRECPAPRVTFGFASFQLDEAAREELERYADCVTGAGTTRVHIAGHADLRGPGAYNKTLSAWRADSVARFLAERGLPSAAISTSAIGEDRPLCHEASEGCHAKNRRVELWAAPSAP